MKWERDEVENDRWREWSAVYPGLSADVLMNPRHLDHPDNACLECPSCGVHRDWQIAQCINADFMPGFTGSAAQCKRCDMWYRLRAVRKPTFHQGQLF